VSKSNDPGADDVLAPRIVAVRKLLARIGGARLCYGEPIKAGGRTIIPVAKMFSAGGGGFGTGEGTPSIGSGGGGGGTLWATPVGFIEVSDTGAHFRSIPDPERSARMLSAAVRTLPALMAAFAGVRALRAGAGPDELARMLRAARGRGVRRRPPRMLPSPRRSLKR
jgi:uncharacterized spore protein YtfJ